MNALKKALDEIEEQKHICRLDFFEQSIFFTKFEEDRKTQYEVSAEDIEQLFSGVSFSTGILPTDTIFYSRKSNVEKVIILKGGCKKKIIINNKELTIPIPDHIFYGNGLEYRIFAVNLKESFLYQMPLPNIYPDGKICQGSAHFTECSPRSIHKNYEAFWKSGFNNDLSEGRIKGNNLIAMLVVLRHKSKFPKKLLVKTEMSLQNLTEEK